MLSRFSLILWLAITAQAFAEPEDSAPPEDFSAAFDMLVATGLPKLEKSAKWVESPYGQYENYVLRQLTSSMKGAAWQMESADSGTRTIPMGQLMVAEMKSEPKEGGTSGMLGRLMRGGGRGDGRPKGEVDLAKDVGKLIAAIDKAVTEQRRNSYYESMGTGMGSVLIFAAQLHQTGHGDLGNRVAEAYFRLYSSREKAVDAAVDQIADYYYQEATQAFFKSGDWKAYQKALSSLLERFPRGWAARDGVRLVMKGVNLRVSGAAPPKPVIPGQKFDPKVLKLVEEMSEMKPAESPNHGEMSEEMLMMMRMNRGSYGGGESSMMNQGLWVLGLTAPAEESGEPESPKQDTCITRLLAMKMAALPVLAALTEDTWPTRLPLVRSESSYFSSRASETEKAIKVYMGMSRPMTRGEIAMALLVQTLPNRQDDLNELDAASVRECAMSFWNDHKNDSLFQLAKSFLHDGSESQSQEVAEMLAVSSDPKAQQLFEKVVLESDNMLSYYNMVENYLQKRRAAGKPFFEVYAAKARESAKANGNEPLQLDSFHGRGFGMSDESGGVEKMIQKLELLVGAQSPEKLLKQIAAGKPEDAEQGIEALMTFMKDEPVAKQLELILTGAEAAQDVGVREIFLRSVPSMFWNDVGDSSGSERAVSDAEKKIWKVLMSDDRVVPQRAEDQIQSQSEDEDQGEADQKSTIAQQAAAALEMSISRAVYYKILEAMPILDRPLNDVFLERAKARLAGGPLPALPDAEKVSKERLAAIVGQVAGKNPVDVHLYVKSLTPDERAAWREWVQDPGELAMPENVKKLRFQITETGKATMKGVEDASGLSTMGVGFEVSAASLRKAIESMGGDFQKRSRMWVRIGSGKNIPGLKITEQKVPVPEKLSSGEDHPENMRSRDVAQSVFYQSLQMLEQSGADGVVLLAFSTSNKRGAIAWNVSNGKLELVKPEDSGFERYGFEALDLEEAFKELKDEPGFQQMGINITILSKADAEKLKQAISN